MNSIITLIAVVFFMAAILVGVFTSSENWKNVVLSWTLLGMGVTAFSIALTL